MAYDPNAHRLLEALSRKYSEWLSYARSAQESGRMVLDADGIESTLSDCYEDARVTAHAVYVYLMENPPPDGRPRRETASRALTQPVELLYD